MKKIWHTLQGKLITITLFILAVLFALVGILQYTFMEDFLYRNKAEALHSEIRSWPPEPFLLNNDNRSPSDRLGPDHAERTLIFDPNIIVSIVSEQGIEKLITSTEVSDLPLISSSEYENIFNESRQKSKAAYHIYYNEAGTEYMVVFRQTGRNDSPYLLQVSYNLTDLNRQLHTQLGIFLAFSILALIAGFGLLRFGLKKSLSPIHHMLQTVERTNAEHLTEKLAPMSIVELDQLAQAYNNMLDRIENSFAAERATNDRMRQFLADASHELRTPITSIYGFIEVLQRGAMYNEDQLQLSLKAMEQEAKRMKRLVEALLQLTKLDQADHYVTMSDTLPISLSQLLADLQLQLNFIADSRKLSIVDEAGIDSLVLADPNQLTQVILNIVQNAAAHTDPKLGSITMLLQASQDQLTLSIADNGVGIAKEQQPYIFDRFYRVNKARTRTTGGAGLGLAISYAIIEAHKGTITVQSELGKGSVFILTLPRHCNH